MSVATVALPIARDQRFEYWVPAGLGLRVGSVVRVTLGRRLVAGVVVGVAQTPTLSPEKLKPIADLPPGVPPVPSDVVRLALFAAQYYHQSPGAMLGAAVPAAALLRGRSTTPAPGCIRLTDDAALRGAVSSTMGATQATQATAATQATQATAATELNSAQREAVGAIVAAFGGYAAFLLRGVTGSGKTEVYLAAAREAIARGGQVLVLVPEINLTPQLAARVRDALPDARVALMHSAVTGRARADAWRGAAAGVTDLVLGTRLAVFAPLPRLALVVVDEEHDASFRQHDGVRYHARDLAVVRARERGVPIVLGSATPSLESYVQGARGRYASLVLDARARAGSRPPDVVLVPARGAGDALLPPGTIAAIGARLARGEQSLVFVNRRGFSPSLACYACGWTACCDRCTARLVLHRDARELRCHHCGHARRVVRACPECGNQDLFPAGGGTQRLEDELTARFPGSRIARVDRDSTTRRDAFAGIMGRVLRGEVDILVGTQMLAKGHDYPRLTLVVVLGADNALYSADFRATERLFSLLMQVGGRAGRSDLPGEMIVHTDFPEHPVYRALVAHDYPAFARELVAERRAARLPPFAHVALISAEARDRPEVDRFLDAARARAFATIGAVAAACECSERATPVLSRRAGYERGQLFLQAERRGDLHRVLDAWCPALAELARHRVRWQIDVDPLEFG